MRLVTVSDIRAKAPCADIYRLDDNARYIIRCDPNEVSRMSGQAILEELRAMGIKALIVWSTAESCIQVLELS